MGCGASRIKNMNPESIPARFRPILRRRIEEVQRRRRLESTKDESTKEELLYKANDIVDDSVALDKREEEVVVEKREGDHEMMILDDDDTDESSVIFPGSPSFRIYFVDNGDSDDDDDGDHVLEIIKEEGAKENKQNRENDALEEKGPKTKIMVKKRRNLKGISKGGQTAVKNLLNVKGCYTPTCGTRPDRAHLISSNP